MRYKNSKLISKQIPWNASTHKSNLNCNLHGICIGLELEWQCSTLSIVNTTQYCIFFQLKSMFVTILKKPNNVIGAKSSIMPLVQNHYYYLNQYLPNNFVHVFTSKFYFCQSIDFNQKSISCRKSEM